MFPAGVCRTAQFETMIHDVKPAYYAVMQSESALKATDTNLTQYGELDRVVFQRVSQEVVAAIEYLELEGSVSQPEVRAGADMEHLCGPGRNVTAICWSEPS